MPVKRPCVDSLRLSDAEHAALLAQLEREAATGRAPDLRNSTRYRYTVREGLVCVLEGCNTNFIVRPRNLSNGGCSVLHGSFVYPGTGCTLVLRMRNDRSVLTPGRVVRCRCVRGRVHEIGIRFDRGIDIEEFVEIGRAQKLGPESGGAEPRDLLGYAPDRIVALARQLQELAVVGAPALHLRRKLEQIMELIECPDSVPEH